MILEDGDQRRERVMQALVVISLFSDPNSWCQNRKFWRLPQDPISLAESGLRSLKESSDESPDSRNAQEALSQLSNAGSWNESRKVWTCPGDPVKIARCGALKPNATESAADHAEDQPSFFAN
jgi:hypothetical protein